MIYPDLDINGMKTETDVCDMICDTIDDGNLSDAMDYVGQFKDYLVKKEVIWKTFRFTFLAWILI